KSYTCSDEVKELKDIGFKGVHVTDLDVGGGYGGENPPQTDVILKKLNLKDISTSIRVPESANCQDHTNPTWTRDQSHIREKDMPSHEPRKQHMVNKFFGARLELIIGFDLRAFEGLNCDLGRGEERIT
nr:hypothetical protein [Tanacetum cinerariifolium]